MTGLRLILAALVLPVTAAAQLSHPLAASRNDVPPIPVRAAQFPDTVRLLAAMVQFQTDNEERTTGNGHFDLSTPSSPVLDAPPHDRRYVQDHLIFLSNYFKRVSKGKIVILPTLIDSIVTVPGTIASYSPPSGGGNSPVGALARDAWMQVDSSGLVSDFSSYDCFVVVHAGAGRDIDLTNAIGYDPTPLDIPSLFIGLNAMKSFFGDSYEGIPVQGGTYHITNSIVVPETESRIVPGATGDIPLIFGLNGLLCSSFGNYLGLPDLFDTKTGKSGIGRFGLMDGQSIFSFGGAFPPEPSAWERYWLGWTTPVIPSPGSNTVSLPAIAIADTIYRVPISGAEYFLVENRNRDPYRNGVTLTMSYGGTVTQRTFTRDTAGFETIDISALSGDVIDVSNPDWSLPGGVADDGTFYDGGILIWHVDESVILPNLAADAVNADPDHRGVNLLEADGSQDIGQTYDFLSPGLGSEEGTELDFWFEGNTSPVYKNELTASTFPGSAANSGAASHVEIRNFSPRGPEMHCTIVRGDNVSPVGKFPLATHEDLFGQQVTVVDAGRYGQIGLVASDGSVRPQQTTSGPVYPASPPLGALRGFEVGNGASLRGFQSDGVIAYARAAGTGFCTPPAVADLNGDGVAEVVIGEEQATDPQTSALRAFSLHDTNGDSLADPLFATDLIGPITAGPVISDSLIAVACGGGKVYFLRFDGSVGDSLAALGDPSSHVAGISRSTGTDGFIITGADGTIRLTQRNPSGSVAGTDVVRNIGRAISGPAATGEAKGGTVIVCATADGDVYAFDQALTPLTGFPVTAGKPISAAPALADIDGDGSRDVVAFGGTRIFAWSLLGVTLDHFPASVSGQSSLASAPVVGDVDGDGTIDILGVTEEGKVVAFDKNGRNPDGFPLQVDAGLQSAALATEGDSVVVLTASQDGSISGWLTGRTQGNPRGALYPWPQYLRDTRRSGLDLSPLQPAPLASGFFPQSRAYNWPNPVYGGRTFIRYFVGSDARVKVKIFDLAGDLVTEFPGPGTGGMDNEVAWDVSGVQSGVYLARIEAQANGTSGVAIVKVAVVK